MRSDMKGAPGGRKPPASGAGQPTTKQLGDAAEAAAVRHLQAAGLRVVVRNYRVPGRGGGEVDLIAQDPSGTLVFVEVRSRASRRFGGAAASVGWVKQQRLVRAAQHYLMRCAVCPPCRFDVLAVENESIEWIQGAFSVSV